MISADLINGIGRLPGVSTLLRWYARRYRDGSVVSIARGFAAGMKWRRHHRYVSGYWIGIYELPLQRAIARELESGNVFYDVGANAGFFSVLAASRVGPTGRVFSFEPMPENIESIREQVFVNGLDRCEVITKAVSDRSGSVSLILTDSNSTAHISEVGSPANEPGWKELVVETVSLDEFVAEHPGPDFIKIDVEGAETEVLAGASGLLGSAQPPRLLIELHGRQKALAVESILRSFGYSLTDLSGHLLPQGAANERHILAYPNIANCERGSEIRNPRFTIRESRTSQ